MPDQELRKDFDRFSQLKPPAKRAAYSDRTAWLMAILSQLAYTRFDEEDRSALLELAGELAELTDREVIAGKLIGLAARLERAGGGDNERLRSILQIGGFELRGVLFDAATDTQGFVAVRHADEDPGMAVVSFRGTQQVRDWMTNLKADKLAVRSDQPGISKTLGHVHKGFNQAFKSVEPQIHRCLRGVEDYPLYFTGHSLGGALATLATWYTAGKRQAACYTFGAPRVGDSRLLERFRTPIYRIVNGADPVPMVPPVGLTIECLKVICRAVGLVITPVNRLTGRLQRYQGYRHYGFQRYLSICGEGPDGTYPRLRNEYGIGTAQRLWRYCRQWFYNEVSARKRLVKYHDIAAYRAKLREYAIRRQHRD